MSGRTPSFIVVGLVIIMLLLGLFYMSCSSKNTELRISVEQFEDRIRSLSIKNSDSAKKLESIDSRKRELEEEKLTIQRQMEKKDSEINDLNTKLNERNAELQSLQSDKAALDEQLKDFKSMSATLTEKDSLIAKLRQQLEDQKQSGASELTRVRQEYEAAKGNQPPAGDQQPGAREPQSNFQIAPDRFRPLTSSNETTRGLAGFLQNSFNRLNNLTKEVKAQIIPADNEARDRVMNVIGASTNASVDALPNEHRQGIYADKHNQEVGQNLPPPQLDNNAPRRAQVESALDRNSNDQMPSDNGRFEQRIQRSVNNSAADNVENDDEAQLQVNDVHGGDAAAADLHQQNDVEGHNELARHPAAQRFDNMNYRVADREGDRNHARVDNGEEVENDDENEELDQRVRKRSVL